MDLNKEYAAHQCALMRADHAASCDDRLEHLARAATIAGRISAFQQQLGAAAAARVWGKAQISAAGSI